ncbi:MAG: heme ABC transporter ATP-binding protein [Confluentimicrobium sp.]|jgi:simple sugar transport system ATP-binding protein|uniref:ABC transporter ATP-binding protein n=1 Tax=Actibacterium sp. TaxID=1872125 RepID=UPI000C4DFAAA|nr:ABC transporter ATP-binding protein [Actibacterium sp.]MBC58535.1 heme ABC transporter ATP-binding protein [Actibacterium sp.]|tara:strand:+ start:19 stop:1530 length:1512 start_codon:yes stop_codon:yes gene_type:complete
MDIELRGVTKRFGEVVANADVNLTIRAGEVLGLLGENGAGKSTLMNVLSGLYRPDEGEILIDGKPARFEGPGDAIRAGIGMVHQHFMLVPVFTVAENVVLGVEPTGRADFLDLETARRQVHDIKEKYGLEVDPDARIENLPVGVQQRVEIIKVLFRSADVLILDEPTAVLTPQEVEEFFGIVRALRDAGKALVFITHKLNEIREIADRISVIRAGRIVGEGDPKKLDRKELAEMMVGRPVSFDVVKAPYAPGRTLLDVQDLTILRDNDEIAVDHLSLSVRSGEIVGIAGVQGNGQSALIEALTGLRRAASGQILFEDQDITHASVRARHRMGIAHIPEDRQRAGIIKSFTVAENMVLDTYYDERFSSGPQINWKTVNARAAAFAEDFDVRTPSVFESAGHLSGGNQQKLVVARELSREITLVVAGQPTRGLDVGSIEYIHKRLVEARDTGDGVLIISSELDEIMALSDRILVMFKGRVVAEFDATQGAVDKGAVGLAMAGAAA